MRRKAERNRALIQDHSRITGARRCKGMAGLVEESQEILSEGEKESELGKDLALIAAAQKVEHYEISGYRTARTMAGQVGLPAVGEFLSKSLAEEKISDGLLTQIARELMSEARTSVTKAPRRRNTVEQADEA